MDWGCPCKLISQTSYQAKKRPLIKNLRRRTQPLFDMAVCIYYEGLLIEQIMDHLLIAITLLSFNVSQGRTAHHSGTNGTGSKEASFTTYNLLILVVSTSCSPYDRYMSLKFSENVLHSFYTVLWGTMHGMKYLSCDSYATARAVKVPTGQLACMQHVQVCIVI